MAGRRTKVEEMIAGLHEEPRTARVAKVVVEEADPDGVATGFSILH